MHDAILARIDALADEEVAFLRELVRVPSDNPPGDCTAHALRAAELLEKMGFTVERHPVPADIVRANGMVSAVNLVVRRRFGDGPVVALNAHGDVVPPGEGWTMPPYGGEVKDGFMYGRGVAVSKSDFATYAFALRALEPVADRLGGAVELHLTYDEEAGGEIGPAWLLEQGISKPDLAIGAGFAHGIVTAHNGCLHLEVEIEGKAAHAARPDLGHDALEATTDVMRAIYALRPELAKVRSSVEGIGSPQITVGLIKGGINTNVVPDRVTLRLDRRLIPEENGADVEAALTKVITGSVAGRPGITVRCTRVMLAEPLKPIAGIEPLVAALEAHGSRVLGHPVKPHGVPLYTDGRHYSARGIPTVLYGAGPRTIQEARGHAADERLSLADLDAATRVVALTLADVLRRG